MPDSPKQDDVEDILTGRKTPPSRRQSSPQGDVSDAPPRAGRSRRKFTVDTLFRDTRPQAVGVEDLAEAKEIALDRIEPDPEQPRRTFDEERLSELAASIRKEGVLQPIVVRYDAERDRYIVVHGERRFRASINANRQSIPALVRNVPEHRRLVQQLMENIVRDDLNAIDRARALRILKDQMDDAPWEDVAAEVGIRRSRLFQLLDTSKLPQPAQDHIRAGTLSEKQSRSLQGLPSEYQQALADAIVERSVSSQVADRIGRALRRSARLASTAAAVRAHIDDLLALAVNTSEDDSGEPVDRLLETLATATDTTDNRSELEELATVLGAPKFTSGRVTRSIGDLALALAHAERSGITEDAALRQRLRTLSEIIECLIAGDSSDP
jgi:ParB family transcriptional regulator, chromosome partitioning protein